MTTALVKKVSQETVMKLDDLQKRSTALMLSNESPFSKLFARADLLSEMQICLQEPGVMDRIMMLQNKSYGFLTDKKVGEQPYSVSAVADVAISAMMAGFRMDDSETMIISGRFYGMKNGYSRNLKELPGLTELKFLAGMPEPSGKIKCFISCNYNGREIKEELEFVVKVNEKMGPDGIVGKAERKAKKWLYGYLTGSEIPDGDIEDLVTGSITVKASPFAAPVDAPVVDAKFEGHPVQQAQAVDYWASANAKCQELGITEAELEAFSQKSLGRPWMEIPDSTLKAICERPQDFLKKIQEMRSNAG